MEGFGQNPGVFEGGIAAFHGHSGEASNKHDFQAGADLNGALGELDPVHAGHDDIGQQEVKGFYSVQGFQRFQSIVRDADPVTGALQRSGEESAHGFIVFSQQDMSHGGKFISNAVVFNGAEELPGGVFPRVIMFDVVRAGLCVAVFQGFACCKTKIEIVQCAE